MFKNTPFEAMAKTMAESAPKFTPPAMQDAIKPAQDNLKAWADLAQNQAREAQAGAGRYGGSHQRHQRPTGRV